MTRRKVLFLIPTLTGGGAERVVVTLLKHLDRQVFDLSLAVVDTRKAAFLGEVPSDVRFIDLGCTRVRHALPRLIAMIWRDRPEVVLSTLGHLNLALAIVRPMLPARTRIVARETIVVSHGLTEYARPRLWAWAYRHFYNRLDRVICQSQDMRDDLVVHFRVAAGQTVVIHNPVDLERIRRAAAQPVPSAADMMGRSSPHAVQLVCAGRLVHQKGFDLLLRAMALTGDARFELTLLGDGPLLSELREQANLLGLQSRVRFVGFQANPYAFFARADAFVLSSRFEGFPNVVLEALACGVPVVALPAPGGVREILTDIPGCIVAQDMTASALAAALCQWKRTALGCEAAAPYAAPQITRQYAEELLRQD